MTTVFPPSPPPCAGRFIGLLDHAGEAYAAFDAAQAAAVADAERPALVRAAERLRALGHSVPIISMGLLPTALHPHWLEPVRKFRAGV